MENQGNENGRQGGFNIICGRNPVMEAVKSGKSIDRLLVSHGAASGAVTAIIAKCKAKGIPVKEVSPMKLDMMCYGANHQGVAVTFAEREYCTLEDILAVSHKKGTEPFILVCDCIEDPHNLGAIIRTAECCAVDGIVIPERRSATLNATVAKSASGALEYMPVARVKNIANTVETLKKNGIWVFAADMDGGDFKTFDFTVPCAIVIGNEGKGIGPLVRNRCDGIVSIPMFGKINSLNASVAAGVLMYEVAVSRNKQ